MNLDELIKLLKAGHADPYNPAYLAIPPDLRAKNTPGKQKDYGTHGKYISEAAGFEKSSDVSLSRLGHGFEATLRAHLLKSGKGDGVVNNCLVNFRLIHDVAVSLGHLEPAPVAFKKPPRHRISKRDENGVKQVLRPKINEPFEQYAAEKDRLPPQLFDEIGALRHYFTAKVVRGRKRKPMKESTWSLNEDRIRRFFGALERMGHPLEQASLSDFIDADKLNLYVDFFLVLHPAPTYTLKDLLLLAKKIANRYFKDQDAVEAIDDVIGQLTFVRVKDIDGKILSVTADDLYVLADRLYEHAMAYKRMHFNQKPGKAIMFPKAMTAYHVERALIVHLALATWLRKDNLFGIEYGKNLYYQGDTLWFKFSAEEMKTQEEHHGQVRDLWRGASAMRRIHELLAEFLSLRPYLIERFQLANPNAEPPTQLFLTKFGTPFAPNGAWYLFSTVSRQYLGEDKEIHPHNVRHIVPSWLLRRQGYTIFSHIQTLLGHRLSATTELHYTRIKRLFSADMGQDLIDKQREQEEMAGRLKRIEGMLEAGMVGAVDLEDLRTILAEIKDNLAS